MAEVVENTENTENETPAVPQMSTVERAEMLLKQDATIREKIKSGATLDEAVDPSNKEFGPLGHPEQVQMRVAKRAMMLESGIAPYPVHLDVTNTIEEVRAKYDGKLEAGQETEDMVGIAGRVLFLRNAGGLCFVQLSAGDGTKIQGMISKKEIGADSLKQFKQLVDLGDHLYLKGRVIASKTGELSVFATEWAIASKALQPLPALHKDLNEDTRTRKPYIGMIADENIRNMVRNRSKADFGGEWKTISMYDSLSEALGEEIVPNGGPEHPGTSVEHLGEIADKLGVERDDVENHGKLVEHLWEHFYEDKLYEPTFVRDFPVETSPLVKGHRTKPGVVEKWDLYVRGFELATGYSELNDPIVQRERFVAQAKDALAGDEEACDIDEDFLEALGVGMPPAGGMGMGIDRLLIALTGATIRETITFPLVKPLVG